MKDVYAHWVTEDRIITGNLRSADLSKLAANAFLAQRISLVNTMLALCKATGTPKSHMQSARTRGLDPSSQICNGLLVADYWKQVIKVNNYQKNRFINRVVSSMFNTGLSKKIAILDFAFKKDTGDTREMPAIDVCKDSPGDKA
ncbi:hypothetical protein Nepgr_032053 [Nepenthes gracilis]|uniref:UDP-glucose/GDP-mannose dehydrogenase dimerisation domain-containing protein n=1 Tax=Nepenthes gracilis TaxID=150966 RepID=A0AAD3Y7D6_NEPGR|nr:hypothetical protein Nepgr_032053 [Nepenthes gracilis]